MAGSDKLRLATSVPSKMYLGKKRVDAIYRADTKTQIFPFAPPLPVIDSVTPASSPLAGGVQVTISGAYFSTASSVKFGGVNASGFTIFNSTTIIATVPAMPEGSAPIVVTNATGSSAPFPFSYVTRAPAQRIVKSGLYTIPASFSYRGIPDWVPDGGYPATAVVNDGIAVAGGVQIAIEAVQLRGGTNTGNRCRLVDTEGNNIAEVTSASPISIASFTYTPTIDTVIKQQGYYSSGLGGNPNVPDNAGSYLMITPQ